MKKCVNANSRNKLTLVHRSLLHSMLSFYLYEAIVTSGYITYMFDCALYLVISDSSM